MTKKVNFWTQIWSTMNGLISFGGLSPNEDVTHSFEVRAMDGRHFITMEEDGVREGWTTMNSPGATMIHCGEDLAPLDDSSTSQTEKEAFVVIAENGDIQLKAANGKIRIEGLDVEICATGTKISDEKVQGNFWVKANENIALDGKNIKIDGKQSIKLHSPLFATEAAMTQIFAGLVYGVTAASIPRALPVPGKMKP